MIDAGYQLPPGWQAGQASDGSTYYINHATKTTSWEPPTAGDSPGAPLPPDYSQLTASPPPDNSQMPPPAAVQQEAPPAAVRQQAASNFLPTAGVVQGDNATTRMSSPPAPHSGIVTRGAVTPCSCRGIFWITAGLSWVVWVFAVAAAGDKNWGEDPTGAGLGVGTGILDDNCSSTIANESACIAYDFFVASERFAAFLCSVAVILFTVACFRPYEATHGSAQVLGLVGGVFMMLFTLFQMAAFLFFEEFKNEHNEAWAEWSSGSYDVSLGPTYGVGVTAFLFGLINAIMVFVLYRQAGDGPLFAVVQGISGNGALAPRPGIQQQEALALPAATQYTSKTGGPGQSVPPQFGSVGGGNV